ncbi:uncharacterized protein [Spinacia oleracea]|uniref:Uncharacterized protein n=1 Tax=Spinacia oleracea TaxID=3562 RepID=A0ABM3QK49_SPIOL|nr:uncharacterized protein LOC110791574 [Spinacia oleracea]
MSIGSVSWFEFLFGSGNLVEFRVQYSYIFQLFTIPLNRCDTLLWNGSSLLPEVFCCITLLLQCPRSQQVGLVESCYYVMKYMDQIVTLVSKKERDFQKHFTLEAILKKLSMMFVKDRVDFSLIIVYS